MVHVTGSVIQCASSMVSLVYGSGPVVYGTSSVVQCTGPVQKAGGVAADQDRHGGGGLGCQGEVGSPQGVIYNTGCDVRKKTMGCPDWDGPKN